MSERIFKYPPASAMLKVLRAGLPQIIAMLFLVGFVAYAWTEPSKPLSQAKIEKQME